MFRCQPFEAGELTAAGLERPSNSDHYTDAGVEARGEGGDRSAAALRISALKSAEGACRYKRCAGSLWLPRLRLIGQRTTRTFEEAPPGDGVAIGRLGGIIVSSY